MRRTRRIIFLLAAFHPGGIERVTLNLANTLFAQGHEVGVIAIRQQGPTRAWLDPLIPVHGLAAQRVLGSITSLARKLDELRPDVVISAPAYLSVALLVAVRLCRRKPRVIVVEHSLFVDDMRGKPARAVLGYRLAPWAYRWADAIAAVSEGLKRDAARALRMPARRLTVLKNAVVDDALLRPADPNEPPPHEWLKPGEPPVVLGVGRLEPEKNPALLIDAFARVRAQRPARLIILGTGFLLDDLRARADRTGHGDDICFPGFVDPFPFMRRAAVFVLSSDWEGLPTVLIEAMACGTQVVSTDCPHGPKEILDGGRLAPLVPLDDAAAMSDAILEVLDRPRDTAALKDRAMQFTFEASAADYLALIERVLGPGRVEHS